MEAQAIQFALHAGVSASEATRYADEAFAAIHAALKPFIFKTAWSLAAKTGDPITSFRDLCSVTALAIFKNLKRWHPPQGRKFSVKIMRVCIASQMSQCLNRELRMIYYPERVVKDIIALNRAGAGAEEENFIRNAGRDWTQRRFETVEHLRDALFPGSASEILEDGFEEGPSVGFRHHCSDNGPLPDRTVHAAEELLSTLMQGLAEFQRRALRMYFGMGEFLGDPHTFARIGEVEKITREGARQRVRVAVRKLKKSSMSWA
jgi:DNA-directed RNA polymerase sigma subunit (sigma70/sigma32)